MTIVKCRADRATIRVFARRAFFAAIASVALFLLPSTQVLAQPSSQYCYDSSCFPTLHQAEQFMRSASVHGPYARKDKTEVDYVGASNQSMRISYVIDEQPPAVFQPESFSIGGWGYEAVSGFCSQTADPHLPWRCSDEAEMMDDFLAYFQNSYPTCSFTDVHVSGGYGQPLVSSQEYFGYGLIHFDTPESKWLNWKMSCPEWADQTPDDRKFWLLKQQTFDCPAGFVPLWRYNPAYYPDISPSIVAHWPKLCGPTVSKLTIYATKVVQTRSCPANANPCYPATGDKARIENDLSFAGKPFNRYYHSAEQIQASRTLPIGWTHSYSDYVGYSNWPYLISADGYFETFTQAEYRVFRGRKSKDLLLRQNDDSSWTLVTADGDTRNYDTQGRLTSVLNARDSSLDVVLTYENDRLTLATDARGRTLRFLYENDMLSRVELGDGSGASYSYDEDRNLVEADYGAGNYRTYRYHEAGLASTEQTHALTGIEDSGQRYASFAYNAGGAVISSKLHTASGTTEETTLSYIDNDHVNVTTPNGLVRQYTIGGGGTYRELQSSTTYEGTDSYTFSADGRPTTHTDKRGFTTTYAYDDSHSGDGVSSVTTVDAVGTSSERTTKVTRNAFNRITRREVYSGSGSSQIIRSLASFSYDADGRVRFACAHDVTTAGSTSYVCGAQTDAPAGVRQNEYRYCSAADPGCAFAGIPESTNGPRTDISDLTTYTYYPSDDATCASSPTTCPQRKGDLQTITNAAGQVTQYLRYDGAGRLLESVDPNGVHTTLTYHPRGWLTSRTVGGLTTSITYDAVGQVIKTTQPDGSFVAYTYDAAHRLTGIADNLGNRIDYTLDAAGNRTAEATKDAGGVLKRSLTRVYDQLGRLSQSIDALGAITQQTYDANGNADLGTDALGRSVDQDVDPLNRLKNSLRDVGGVAANTAYAYDAQDNLTEVTDPNGLKTTYTYNGLNDLTQLSSPDTGTTTYTYDAAGNRLSQTDARGVATNYRYDALNRLTDIAYPDAALDAHFDYDIAASACAIGEQSAVGRLSGFTDASGNTALCYDPLGRLTRKQQTTAGIALATTYTYAANGRLAQMTTPGGMVVSYGYDSAGRINAIDTQLPNDPAASVLIDDVHYLPFGPIDQITFGNGRIQTRNHDANYAIDQVSSTGADGLSLDFGVDAVGNLTQVTSGAAGNLLAYDGVDRLTEVKQLNNDLIEAFAYDATGNRTAHTDTGGVTPYSYTAGSHRLSAVGATTRSVDAAGNTTAIGGTAFTYDDRNRMSAATVAGRSTQYQYNARGERVSKAGTANTIFVYDEAGHLLGEYASDGSVRTEYVWLGDLPVAVRSADDTMAYIEPDHLGTPRAVIDPTRDVAIWQWPLLGNAFGDAAPVTDPDADGVVFAMNLRFPGQYFDAETGLHYNYYRNYDPSTGRYVESDPIGQRGGINTYLYALASPTSFRDRFGLAVQCETVFRLPFFDVQRCADDGMAASTPIPRPRDMDRLEERAWDRYCEGTSDPCDSLKRNVRVMLADAQRKINEMLHDKNRLFGGLGWVTHTNNLEGRLANIWAAIRLGEMLGCDMSFERSLAASLFVPTEPLPSG